MDSIRERVNLFLYQFAICTDHRLLFNCFETARFICTLENDYEPTGHRYKVVSLGWILFEFCSSPRETCVKRTQLSDVASCHALKIQVLTML